jgi:hypothetical protein
MDDGHEPGIPLIVSKRKVDVAKRRYPAKLRVEEIHPI